MWTKPTMVLLCLMFIVDVPSVFPSPLSASHAASYVVERTTPPASRLLQAFLSESRTDVKVTASGKRAVASPQNEILFPSQEHQLHIASKLSQQPLSSSSSLSHTSSASISSSSSSQTADTQAHTGTPFARRTRHISMPQCLTSLRGICRRIRIGSCWTICLNNVFKRVCRTRFSRRGRSVCSVQPYEPRG